MTLIEWIDNEIGIAERGARGAAARHATEIYAELIARAQALRDVRERIVGSA